MFFYFEIRRIFSMKATRRLRHSGPLCNPIRPRTVLRPALRPVFILFSSSPVSPSAAGYKCPPQSNPTPAFVLSPGSGCAAIHPPFSSSQIFPPPACGCAGWSDSPTGGGGVDPAPALAPHLCRRHGAKAGVPGNPPRKLSGDSPCRLPRFLGGCRGAVGDAHPVVARPWPVRLGQWDYEG